MKKVMFAVMMALSSLGVKAVNTNPHLPPCIIFEPNDESIMVGKLLQKGYVIRTMAKTDNIHTYLLQKVEDNKIITISYTFKGKVLYSEVKSVIK